MLIDFNKISAKERIHYMYHTIVPRPIAWITTQNDSLNIAPFSFFSGVSSSPPIVMVAIGHKTDGSQKDTLRNIRETKKCVINMVDPAQIEKMHSSSTALEYGESEADVFNIPTLKLLDGYPPIIKDTPAAFFCKFHSEHAINESRTVPIFLEIEHCYVDKKIKKHHEPFNLELLARMGQAYGRVDKFIDIPKQE